MSTPAPHPAPGPAAPPTAASPTAVSPTAALPTAASGPAAPPTAAPPTPALPRPGRSAPVVLAVAVATGLVVGALTSFGQTVLGGGFAGLANAVSPWLVAPFLVGALARRDWVAALAGVLVCAAEVAGYYVTADLRGFPVGATSIAVWVVSGVVGGPVFGAAGRLWRTAVGRWRGLGPALLVGCWLAEAVVTYAIVLRYGGEALVFGVVAVLLVPVLGRVGRQTGALLRWLPVAALVGAAGFGTVHVLLAALLA